MRNRVRERGFVLAVAACTGLGVAAARLHQPARAAASVDKKAAGAELYANSGCTHCHGDNGQGTDRAPALRELRKKLSAQRMNDQIVHGGQGMPAFGDALKPEQVDDLVSFLRAKKWITPPAAKEAPSAAPATSAPSNNPS